MKETFVWVEGLLQKCPWHNPDCFYIALTHEDHLKCYFPRSLLAQVYELQDQLVRVSGLVTEKPGYLHEKRIAVQKLEGLESDVD